MHASIHARQCARSESEAGLSPHCGCPPPVAVCAGVVPGPFQLHPSSQTRNFPVCLLNFKLPAEQLLRHLHSVADWQQLPVLTDADITARATRLGLLPAKTLEAKGVCHPAQQPGGASGLSQ